MIDKILFQHPLEETYLQHIKDSGFFLDEVMDNYKNFEEKYRLPDLLGKTLKVGKKQFFNIYKIAEKISKELDMDIPNIYIYEDFYYGVESKGATDPWIEISSKTVEDFSMDELTFLIAKQLCSIKLGHTYYQTLIDETLEAYNQGQIMIGADTAIQSMKLIMCKYSRVSHYTSDCFGYIATKNLKACISAISKCILNSCFLAKQLDVNEFIKQGEEINRLNDMEYEYTKLDERIPYGPYRVKNLIAYASSENGMKVI